VEASWQSSLDSLAREAGFSLAGIAAVPEPGSQEDLEERSRFEEWIASGSAGEMEYLSRRDDAGRLLRSSVRVVFPWVRSVIVCAADYDSSAPRSVDPAPQGTGWIARYAQTGAQTGSQTGSADKPTDYHKVLLKRLETLRDRLQPQTGSFESRCYVDTGPLVERVYARYAGIGWTGKNTCILNQQLGSWLFLGVILTSLEVHPEQLSLPAADRCGSCTRCIDACPTGALIAPRQMDASRCISYLTIEKRGEIPENLREAMGRQVFGCDICQDVCPWNVRSKNKKAQNTASQNQNASLPDPEFTPRAALINPALGWLAAMDEADFGRWFFGSPVKRAKFNGFRRNIAIAMGNSGYPGFLSTLRGWAQGADPVLAETARWAILRLESAQNSGLSSSPDANGLSPS
jgi:epoxyqueuosine reductase